MLNLPDEEGFAEPGWQRRMRFAAVAGVHVLLLLGLLTVQFQDELRPALANINVRLLAEENKPAPPPPTPPVKPPPPRPSTQRPLPPPPLLTAATPVESNAPAAFSVAPALPRPAVEAPANAPPAPPAPPVFTAARFDAAYLQNPPPDYPAMSRRLNEEGRVVLQVLVSPEGKAEQVDIKTSSHFSRLDQAAVDAVRRWRFVPAKRGDEAVASTVLVPLVFRLDQAF